VIFFSIFHFRTSPIWDGDDQEGVLVGIYLSHPFVIVTFLPSFRFLLAVKPSLFANCPRVARKISFYDFTF